MDFTIETVIHWYHLENRLGSLKFRQIKKNSIGVIVRFIDLIQYTNRGPIYKGIIYLKTNIGILRPNPNIFYCKLPLILLIS